MTVVRMPENIEKIVTVSINLYFVSAVENSSKTPDASYGKFIMPDFVADTDFTAWNLYRPRCQRHVVTRGVSFD